MYKGAVQVDRAAVGDLIRVLLVEDTELDAQVLRASLQQHPRYHFELVHLTKLETALGWLAGNTPDVILLDLGLEDSAGLETLARLRGQAPEVPLIVITGTKEEALAEQALQAGAQDYLVKSDFKLDTLVRSMRYAIERQKSLRARQASEQALRRQERRSLALIENAPDGIVLVSEEGRFLFASPSALRLFGYEEGELRAGNPADYTHPDDLSLVLEALARLGQEPTQPQTLQYRFQHKEGSWRWVESAFTNLLEEPSVQAIVINFRDITERRRVEAQIEENARRHRLMADLSVAINAAQALPAKLQLLTDAARQIIPSHQAAVQLTPEDRRTQDFMAVSLSERYGQYCIFDAEPSSTGLLAHLRETQQPLRLTQVELENHPRFKGSYQTDDRHPPLNGLLALPLTGSAGGTLGLLMLSDRLEGEFSADDEAVLRQIAHIAAGIIEQDRLHSLTLRRLAEQELVNEIARSLRIAPSHQALLEAFMERCRAILNFEAGCFAWHDRADDRLVLLARQGVFASAEPEALEDGARILSEMAVGGQIQTIADFQRDERLHPALRATVPAGWSGLQAVVESGDRLEGYLLLASPAPPDAFSASPYLFTTLLEILGNALHRVRLMQDAQTRAEHLSLINRLGRELSSTFDPHIIYHTLQASLLELYPDVEAIIISRYDPDEQQITAAYLYHDGHEEPVDGLPVIPLEPSGRGTQSQAIHTRQPVIINDYPAAMRQLKAEAGDTEAEVIQSAIYAPMLAKGEVVGVLNLQHRRRDRFDPSDGELLTWVANTSAVALQNAELFREAMKKIDQQQALRMIDTAITASMDLRVTLNVILEQVTSQQEVPAAAILLADPEAHTLRFAAGRGFRTEQIKKAYLRLGESLAGRAALERRIIQADSPEEMARYWTGVPFYESEGFHSYMAVPLVAKGQVQGVLELYDRKPLPADEDWHTFLKVLAGQAAVAVDSGRLLADLQRSNTNLALAYDNTIEGWSRALDLRDKETEGHTLRVTEMTVRLARAAGLPEREIMHIRRGALLHDIGKMGVPDHILLKPEALTDEEWVIMKQHTTHAYELLSPIAFLRPALDIPYCHHEKWDGTGYPRGLKGEEIPFPARLFALADVWDALTSDRPYRQAWSKERALQHITSQSGTHFDPRAVELFLAEASTGEMEQPSTSS
jgi:PAS domain S-box-containing protein